MDFKSNPNPLFELGFERFDDSSDRSRFVRFRKRLYTIENLAFTLEITYDLAIYDDSDVDYLSNLYWNYEKTHFEIKELTEESIIRDSYRFLRRIEVYPKNLSDLIKYMEIGKIIEKLTDEIS